MTLLFCAEIVFLFPKPPALVLTVVVLTGDPCVVYL